MRLASQLSQGTCQRASTGTRHCFLTRFIASHRVSQNILRDQIIAALHFVSFRMICILVRVMLNVTIHYNSDFDKRFSARLSKIYVSSLCFISPTPLASMFATWYSENNCTL